MSASFRTWIPDYGHEPDEAVTVEAYSAACAAERRAEREFRKDPFTCIEVRVQVDGTSPTGDLFMVDVEAIPSFVAHKRKEGGRP